MATLLRLLVSLCIFRFSFCSISCKNEQNQPVDWFVVYKIPQISGTSDRLVNSGYAHLYMDQSTNGRWIMSNMSIQSPFQSVGFTLNQFYQRSNDSSSFRVLYNDEWPSGNVSMTKGHAKGIVLSDTSTGIWIIHSVPKFPPANSYAYPTTGARYGQSFLCVSFNYSSLQEIGRQLLLSQPYIYSWQLPPTIDRDNKELKLLIKKRVTIKSPFFRKVPLRSIGGLELISFAKHKMWNKELYTDFVAPILRDDLCTETWQNGAGDMGSNCTQRFHVYNVLTVELDQRISFSNRKDHSKWATTMSDNKPKHWICIGDINRQKEQFRRSGGTMCFDHQPTWNAYRQSVGNWETCPVD